MGKLVFAAIVFVVGYALYVTVQRQRRLLPATLAEIVPRAILAVAIGIPALIVLFSIFRIIPAGQVGVKVLFGEVEPVPLREGLNVVWNPLYDIVIMDTRVQKHTTRYDAASKDLQAVIAAASAKGRGDAAREEARGVAEALRLKGDAEAAYNARVAASLTPVLIQQQYLARWDGRLPQYTLGSSSAVPFLQIPTPSDGRR